MKIKTFTQSTYFAPNGGFPKIANNQVFHNGFTDARAIISKPIEVNLPPGIDNSIKADDVVVAILVFGAVVVAGVYIYKIYQEQKRVEIVLN